MTIRNIAKENYNEGLKDATECICMILLQKNPKARGDIIEDIKSRNLPSTIETKILELAIDFATSIPTEVTI